jgi:hypothetical protein
MSILILVVLFAFLGIARGQDYRFERRGDSYQFIEREKPRIILIPLDTRPFWLRMLRSLRPYTMASPGTRMSYNEDLNLYELDGAIGIGIRGKVDF